MASNYPAALDNGTSLPNPTTTNNTNNPSHAGLHDNENAGIIATQIKLGTGSSTPVVNTLMYGTGTGTSAWTQLTSSQLAASMADETGTGVLVFGTTATLITPKVDTINESTPGNGTTIGGVNIKSGALVTSNSIITANITDGAVTGSKIATNAIILGYAQIVSAATVASATRSDLSTPLSVTVTVPAGGRDIEIVFFSSGASSSGAAGTGNSIAIMESTTCLGQLNVDQPVVGYKWNPCFSARVSAPSAGSHTYKIQAATSSGTITITAGAANPTVFNPGPTYILVKAI